MEFVKHRVVVGAVLYSDTHITELTLWYCTTIHVSRPLILEAVVEHDPKMLGVP
jgi:hypothetical protein